MTFLRFLAWAFYWMRLELAALQQPERPCSVTRVRDRWRVQFGESVAEAREAWAAIRLLLEGRPETEPIAFAPTEIADAADELETMHDKRAAESARAAEDLVERANRLAAEEGERARREAAELVRIHNLEAERQAAAADEDDDDDDNPPPL